MAPLATLTLFPPHSLDTSILAAVLVGVVILALLTETWGWTFVGLVVPGYLASVFVIHPEAGFTVAVEAVLTYLLALALSRGVAATGAWSEFFGRERFFLIVICSVLVRALSEVVLLPRIGVALDGYWGTTFSVDRSLHSIGLVLVPLTANAFWKVGLRRGAFQVTVPVALTFALLHFVLLPYTNLSFTSLELTYEDVAQRFLASPKAYIILLTTALLAARFNLRYGWDFNGILVAALVALTWLGPLKLVSTLGEVLVLVAATRALLMLPGLGTLNLEGPRKTVLVFSLGFLLKFIIGWGLGGQLPGLKVTDLFGFGYLIPTLLAVKILQKQLTARVLLPTVHTSLAGVVLGSLVGFPLSLVEPSEATASSTIARRAPERLGLTDTQLGVMAHARATCREDPESQTRLWPRRKVTRLYERMWRSAGQWMRDGDSAALSELRDRAWDLNLELLPVDTHQPGTERFAVLERPLKEGYRGLGMAVVRGGARGPALLVPRPVSEAPSAEAASVLCDRVDCRALVVSGVDTGLPGGDALAEEEAPLWAAARALRDELKVLLRADGSLSPGDAVLHAAAEDLAQLTPLWPTARHDPLPAHDPETAGGAGRIATLRAHPDDLRALVAPVAVASDDEQPEEIALGTLLARLHAWAAGSEPVRELEPAELVFLERQVAAPLLGTGADAGHDASVRFAWARQMGALVGLEVTPVTGCDCWLVAEPPDTQGRLGALAVLSSRGASLALTVPSPRGERGSAALAAELWRKTGARALVLGAAGATSMDTPRTAFQAFHQAVSRAVPEGGLVAQVRGFARRAGMRDDLLVTLELPVFAEARRPEAVERLWAEDGPLQAFAGRVRYHDAAPELVGLSSPSPQQAWRRARGGADHATLWFSAEARGAWVASRSLHEALEQAGLAPRPLPSADPRTHLLAGLSPGKAGKDPRRAATLEQRFVTAQGAVERLLRQRAVHELRSLAPSDGRRDRVRVALSTFYSDEHGQPWMLVEARAGNQVVRGLWFLQQDLPAAAPVELQAGAPGATAALEEALWRRTPVVVRGWAEGAKR
jgi:hypothetical protein